MESGFARLDRDILREHLADGFINHTDHGEHRTRDQELDHQESVHTRIPNFWLRVTHLVGEGDHVAARDEFGGHYHHELPADPEKGEPFRSTGMLVARFEGDKIGEIWTHLDRLGMREQIGI